MFFSTSILSVMSLVIYLQYSALTASHGSPFSEQQKLLENTFVSQVGALSLPLCKELKGLVCTTTTLPAPCEEHVPSAQWLLRWLGLKSAIFLVTLWLVNVLHQAERPEQNIMFHEGSGTCHFKS